MLTEYQFCLLARAFFLCPILCPHCLKISRNSSYLRSAPIGTVIGQNLL